MKPFEFDSRNFSRRSPVRSWFHKHQIAGRVFAIVGILLVFPTHGIAGAIKQAMDDGVDEFLLLARMAFGPWKDRNPKTRAGEAGKGGAT